MRRDLALHAPINAADPVARHARLTPTRPALVCDDVTLSYAALDDLAARTAGALAARGVSPGDRVALLLPNGVDFVAAYLGALRLGAVAAAVSPLWGAAARAAAIADADARALVTTTALAEELDAAGVRTAARLLGGTAGANSLARAQGAARPLVPPRPLATDAPAALLYTSGTTGTPRGVLLSHGNVAGNAAAKARCCATSASDRVALFVPLSHVYGQNAVLNSTLHAGGTVVLYPRFDADRVAVDARAGRLTMLFGLPTALVRLLEAGLARGRAGALRFACSAATMLAPALAARWEDATGIPVHEGYGLTESSPLACWRDARRDPAGSVGRPIPGVAVRIAADDGSPAAPGDPGEVLLRGPNVMLGYWRRRGATATALRDGWLHTGDLGCLAEDGTVRLLDRLDDRINVSGFKVYPAEVERVLLAHPAVAEAAAYAVPDPVSGARVEACVVPVPGVVAHAALADALRAACAGALAPYQVPRRVLLREELPRGSSGKVLRRALREAAAR